jgi:hypothetical protein
MSTAPVLPFHIVIPQQQDEGLYTARFYCVPKGTSRIFSEHTSALGNDLFANPTVLDASNMDTFGAIAQATESDYEQSVPTFQTLKVQLNARPELIPLIQAGRAPQSWEVWLCLDLTQQILDAPDRSKAAKPSLTWPTKTRNVFWGRLNNTSLHGKPSIQQQLPSARVGRPTVGVTNELSRADKNHIGEIDMEFIHWMLTGTQPDIWAALDGVNYYANPYLSSLALNDEENFISLERFLFAILSSISPTLGFFVADERLTPFGVTPANWALVTTIDKIFGNLEIAVSNDGTTWFQNLGDIYIPVSYLQTHALFYNSWTNPLGPDFIPQANNYPSLYAAANSAELLALLMRELFLTIQFELPPGLQDGNYYYYVNSDVQDPVMHTLIMPMSQLPLAVYIDNDQDGIDYNPCGAYASQYKITEPNTSDLFPQPPYTTIDSAALGGSNQSYTTLFRFMGTSIQNGSPVNDPRGFELYVKGPGTDDHLGSIMVPALFGKDLVSKRIVTDWTNLHAIKRIARWGMPLATLKIAGAGVGIEPFGVSANDGGTPITPPKQTFLLWDWGEFPLQRSIKVLPGIFSTEFDEAIEALSPGQNDTAREFLTIGVSRTPGAGIEWTLLETLPPSYILPPSSPPPITTPPPTPPPNGPPDPPTTNITNPTGAGGLAGNLSGTKSVDVTATNTFGVAQVSMYVDNVLVDTQLPSRTSGAWSFTLHTTNFSGTIASPHVHTLTIVAYDLGGNTGTATLSITIAN